MTQIQPAALPTFSGKSSGGIPNLFWRRISHEQLRAQAKYHGLPPVEQLQFESTADYRCGRLAAVVLDPGTFVQPISNSILGDVRGRAVLQ